MPRTAIYYIAVIVALCRGFFKAAKYVAVNCAGISSLIYNTSQVVNYCYHLAALISLTLFCSHMTSMYFPGEEVPSAVIVMYLSFSGFVVSTLCVLTIMLLPVEQQIEYGLKWQQPDFLVIILPHSLK